MSIFAMPSLGADMEAGTLVEWLVKPGDTVKRGDAVAVVETQKGAIEIEIFEDGVVERLDANLGEKLAVGAPLALIRGGDEEVTETAAPPAPPPEPAAAAQEAQAPAPAPERAPPEPVSPPPIRVAPPAAPPPRTGEPPAASPAARSFAGERGLDLSGIRGSGPDGAIVLRDVEGLTGSATSATQTAKPAAAASGGPKAGLDLAEMRVAIAKAMARSKHEIPHYYLSQTIDLQPATDWLSARNADRPPGQRVLMGALFVKAASLAAARVEGMNGLFVDGAYRASEAVHAGVAVALRGGGLIAPAIHDADRADLASLMASMRDLVARARTGRLRSSEMTDGTITVSSMGETGAEVLTGVIYPPQVALVGFGAPKRRPWIVDETIAPRTIVTVTLAADHRVSDGRRGARYLAELDRLLQEPAAL